MKKFIIISLFLVSFFGAKSQETDSKDKYTKGNYFGVHLTAHDFISGSVLKQSGLSGLFANSEWKNMSNFGPGLEFSYIKGLSNTADLQANLGFAYVQNPLPGAKKSVSSKLWVEATSTINVKLLDDSHTLSPYLIGGIGTSRWDVYHAAFIPIGMGLQIKPEEDVMIQLQVHNRFPVTTSVTTNHLFYSVGIIGKLSDSKKKQAPPPPPPPPPPAPAPKPADSDGDGVVDVADQCPNNAGSANLGGCPDSDADGIADKDDGCPNNAGPANLKGCPDADGDGIADKDDACPNLAGITKFNGCPDSDNDEIPDNEDKCPSVAGTPENAGCPALEFNPSNVEFIVSSAVLTKKAKTELNKLISILNEKYPSIRIQIEGHTDASGNPESNQKLSEDRANAVKNYLVEHHVDGGRLSAAGFGSTVPASDNDSAAGKQKNRRVEFKIVK